MSDAIYSRLQQISLNNKYYIWYISLCKKAKERDLKKDNGIYIENHHIIPRCIDSSLIKNRDNLIPMTAREHYIAHILLVKFVKNEYKGKMISSVWFLIQDKNTNVRVKSSRFYEAMKIRFSKNISDRMMGNDLGKYNKGRIVSDEQRKRHSQMMKGRKKPPRSEEYCRNISISKMGKRNGMFGKKLSKEHLKRLVNFNTGHERMALDWEIIFPDGRQVRIKNLRKYCRENNLNFGHLASVARGIKNNYKGIKCVKLT